MARPPPRGPPWKPLLRVSVFGLLSAMMRDVVRYYSVCVCVCVCARAAYFVWSCLSRCVFLIFKSGLSAEPIPSGVYSLSSALIGTPAHQERLIEYRGVARPLGIKVSRGVSSEEGGAAHGPSTPRCSPQSFLLFVIFRMSRTKLFVLASCSGLRFGGICQ